MNRHSTHIVIFVLLGLLIAGCSTTRRLGGDDTLYVGVKEMRFEPDSGVTLSSAAESAAKAPLSVAPNNPLYSPFVRTPLPIGLWAYNSLYTPKEKGIKHWLYRKLAKEPVLVSDVQPDLRVKLVEDILGNYGYFGSEASYELLHRRNPKKAKIDYTIRVGKPYLYSSIQYPAARILTQPEVDSLAATSLLKVGAQYNLDTLSAERQRITTILRNKGYYFFRPDYIEYLADTTQEQNRVALRLAVTPSIPEVATRAYTVGDITIRLQNIGGGPLDTLAMDDYRIIYQKPLNIRPRLLSRSITLSPGSLFTLDAQTTTQNNLAKLGMFRSVNLSVTSPDSLRGSDSLNVMISAGFDYPLEAEVEMNVTSKSNSFVGPGLSLRLSNNNLFRGGEVLSLKLNGSYEWQTGNSHSGGTKSSLLNSYEFGLDATLDIPRLIFPGYFKQSTRYPSRTRFQLGVNLMNRPKYFRILSESESIEYNLQSSAQSHHNITILKLTYNKLLHTTKEFDQTMDENPAIALSFRNQFIPSMSYTYSFDKTYRRNRLFWQSSVTSAGNMLYALMRLCGRKTPMTIFNNQFSQFVKATSEIRFYQKSGEKNWMVYRLMVGAEHPYGNSSVVPYTEQFYIGGANSIRAFTIRSLGPGSYHPADNDRNAYLDQTGTFKLEANLEFRFGLLGRLNGAVFLDAGNIWLLKEDPMRPGGKLTLRDLPKDIALGTGFGLRYDISYLVIRADLGIGIHAPYDTGKKGYYNIPRFKDGLGFHLAIGYPF